MQCRMSGIFSTELKTYYNQRTRGIFNGRDPYNLEEISFFFLNDNLAAFSELGV